MKTNIFLALFVLMFGLLLAGSGNFAYAQEIKDKKDTTELREKTPCPEGKVCLENPLGATVTIPVLIRNIITAVLGIVGSLALLMFIYGGFTWMMSGGNSESVKKGKDILVWAAIGLVVIFSSYALVKFVLESLPTK